MSEEDPAKETPDQEDPSPEIERCPSDKPQLPAENVLFALIIISSLIFAWFLIKPLFNPGYLMNFDHPLQQGVLKCALESRILTPTATWCSFLQAGIPPFQAYPSFFYILVLISTKILDLETAYKAMLVLVWLLLPTLIAFILYQRGHRIAAGFAFSILLLDHGIQDSTGLEFFILGGSGFNQMLGFALLAAVLSYSISTFKNPAKWRFGVLSILTAFYFLAHPPTSILYIPVFLTMLVIFRDNAKKRPGLYLGYPLIAFLIACYFIIPIVFNLQSNNPDIATQGIHSIWSDAYSKLSTIHPVVLLLGLVGLVLIGIKGRQSELWAIPAFATGIFLAWVIHPVIAWLHVFDYAEFPRTIGIMHALILIGCAYSLERIATYPLSKDWKAQLALVSIGMVISGAVIGADYAVTLDRAVQTPIITSSNPLFEPIITVLQKLNTTSGRILLEETFGQTTYPVNLSTAWGIGPAFTDSDLIHPTLRFFKYPYSGTKDYQIMNQRVETMEKEDYLALLEDWNIEYVVAGSGPYRSAFRFLPIEMNAGPMIVYKNTATPVNYFRIGKGKILSFEYHKTHAKARVETEEFTNLIFKVRYWKNWEARIDGRYVPIQKSRQHLMIITVPEGSHIVEFEYITKWWDYSGYLLSLAGLAIAAWMILPKMIPILRAAEPVEDGKDNLPEKNVPTMK